MRIFSLIAGAAALAAALGRLILGRGEIAAIQDQLAGSHAGISTIVWHGTTYFFAILGVALIVSARASRETALSIGLLATAMFGGLAAMMAVYAVRMPGGISEFLPLLVVGAVAILSALAASRA